VRQKLTYHLNQMATMGASEEWKNACDEENKSHNDNNTWKLVDSPDGTRVIDSGWIYRQKIQKDGTINRWKTRLVTRGYEQTECHTPDNLNSNGISDWGGA
jgi:hypothetical protein